MDQLEGRSVTIEVGEPFELIAEKELIIHGTVTDVGEQEPETIRVAVTSDDSRLEGIRWVSATPRYQGDSFASLGPGSVLIVHGMFFTAGGESRPGYIGSLRIVP